MILNLFKKKRSVSSHTSDDWLHVTLDDVDRVKKTERAWPIFKQLLAAYRSGNGKHQEAVILRFIGTETPLDDVLDAMNSEFDDAFYLQRNPDVAAATDDAVTHYLLYGWRENRNPSLFFDHRIYPKLHAFPETVFPLAHYRSIGKATDIPANGISNQYWYNPKAPLDTQWNILKSACRNAQTRAVVIMPVYKGYDETLSAIYHVLQNRGSSAYSLLVINDCSPDVALSDKLQTLADKGLFDYYVNKANRGFVQTINVGLGPLSAGLDVILLNSDAYVFPGWFDRMIAHADRDPQVATITPLSNNATICSYPCFNEDNHLSLEVSVDTMDGIAATANAGVSVETPTGVGFCMYMRRSVIDAIGGLDSEAFKVGYGEENDFCMRARGAGFRNVVACDVFVFHKGSVSFAGIKNENFDQGQKALAVKHPQYASAVRNHISADPELPARRALDAERLTLAMSGAVVFITHKWMGGIDTFLAHHRRELKRAGIQSLLLRVHDRRYVTFETWPGDGPFIPNLGEIDFSVEAAFIRNILLRLSPKYLHVNSFAGLDWSTHREMLEMIQSSGIPYDYFGHDYAPISHSYHLLRPDNVFSGVPSIATRKLWARMRNTSGSADACDPQERQDRYRNFLQGARSISVPSASTRDIYQAEFPELPILVVPHADHSPDTAPAVPPPLRDTTVVAIIGAIGPHKGSDVLAALAAHAQNADLKIGYHLIGYSNQDSQLASLGVRITGRYHDEAVAFDYLDRIQPDLILIPSIWPETFCYTLSLALKKQIPTAVFDLGAQAERVRSHGRGHVLPIELIERPAELTEALMQLTMPKTSRDTGIVDGR